MRREKDAQGEAQGEFKVEQMPALWLKKSNYKGEVRAYLNFRELIKEARAKDKEFPAIPIWGGKQFCQQFMTAKCGCKINQNPWYHRASSRDCDCIHLDLVNRGNANEVSIDTLKQLVDFVRKASKINEEIELMPEHITKIS